MTASKEKTTKVVTKKDRPVRKAAVKAKGSIAKKGSSKKRTPSGYHFFCQEHRDKVKEDHPGASFGKIGSVLGEKWRNLSEEARNKYMVKAYDATKQTGSHAEKETKTEVAAAT